MTVSDESHCASGSSKAVSLTKPLSRQGGRGRRAAVTATGPDCRLPTANGEQAWPRAQLPTDPNGRACRALRCRAGSRAARDTVPHAKPCATGTRCRVGMLRASGPSHSKWDSVPSRGKWDSVPSRGKWDSVPSRGKWDSVPSRGKWDSGPQPHRPPELVVRFLHPCQRLPRLGARVHGLARRGLRMGCVVARNAARATAYGVQRTRRAMREVHQRCGAIDRAAP
jgi:hypothetical protein